MITCASNDLTNTCNAASAATYRAGTLGRRLPSGSGRKGRHIGGTADMPRVHNSTVAMTTEHAHMVAWRKEEMCVTDYPLLVNVCIYM